MPRDREKNIWPPAVANTWKMLGASSITPFATAQPGTNIYFRPFTAPGRVQARMMQISSATNSAGIPTEQTFSIPPPTPPRTMSMVSATKMIRSTNTPSTMPLILPVPPTNETPPMTQAAMASDS